jgi:hypothetical protein
LLSQTLLLQIKHSNSDAYSPIQSLVHGTVARASTSAAFFRLSQYIQDPFKSTNKATLHCMLTILLWLQLLCSSKMFQELLYKEEKWLKRSAFQQSAHKNSDLLFHAYVAQQD